MVFIDDEVDENFLPDESNNLQPEQEQHHFADRSFVSGNNSFIEGGNELMLPPAMGRGG